MIGVSALYMVLMLVLIMSGVWIAFAIGFTALLSLWQIMGDGVLSVIGTFAWQTTTSFTLTAVPLFILMGEVLYRSGLTDRLFAGLSQTLVGVPGGLLQANIVGATLFAASSGSSVASAAALAPMTYKAEVTDRGYDERLVLGTLAAGGTLGILIPPSIVLILYGATTGISVGELFAAGVVPGLVLGLMYMLYISALGLARPSIAPRPAGEAVPRATVRLRGLVQLWPFILLAVIVLGSIYGGIATPTESAALGAVVAFILAVAFARIDRTIVRGIALTTVRTTSMLFFIVIAANVMAMVLSRYGVGQFFSGLAAGAGPAVSLLFIAALYLVLGMFFDAISLMLLTLPVVMPIVQIVGYDPVWFGIILVILLEAGLLTPPVGMNLFVVQGSTGANLSQVVRGSLPFIVLQLLALALFAAVPEIVLWLPQTMR
ncbi:MAG: TRAP transporter large permease subunit [Actinobacteria bacterium]|nr:TRAP transporter large permease subunit [Actinomycetota bacterium]